MLFQRLFAPTTPRAPAPNALYASAVAQARRIEFYTVLGIPDTIDGRFELISLHVYLILRRLRADHARTRRLAQDVFDVMFADMDGSLREMGAGDPGVGPRVKKMARNFYGRIAAYDVGLDGTSALLEDALRRNLYGTVETPDPASVAAMAEYLRREGAALSATPLNSIVRGTVAFGTPSARIEAREATGRAGDTAAAAPERD